MQAHEAAHIVHEDAPSRRDVASHAHESSEARSHEQAESLRRRIALWVAFLAMLLALASMLREQATKDVITGNIQASDTYNFFQAKNIRQTDNQLAADQLETVLQTQNPGEPLRSQLEQRLAGYRANIARYESEPSTGEGKKELLQKAQAFEHERNDAEVKTHSFHYAESLLQMAIVVASVSILALSLRVVAISGVLSVLAILLLLNGVFIAVHLPV